MENPLTMNSCSDSKLIFKQIILINPMNGWWVLEIIWKIHSYVMSFTKCLCSVFLILELNTNLTLLKVLASFWVQSEGKSKIQSNNSRGIDGSLSCKMNDVMGALTTSLFEINKPSLQIIIIFFAIFFNMLVNTVRIYIFNSLATVFLGGSPWSWVKVHANVL